MAKIRKAVKEDFELIYPLLKDFNARYMTRKDWKRLFYQNWDTDEGYCGYIMMDQNEAVGFLGLLFNQRIINGEKYKFCNLTSWIVYEKYRSKSIFMLQPVLKLKSYTITDFTPSKEVYNLLKRAGFKQLESYYRFIFPLPNIIKRFPDISFIEDKKVVNKELDDHNRSIFLDHQFRYCHHILIKTSKGKCYIVMTRMVRKKMPFLMARVHYISDLEVFNKYFNSFRFWLCSKFKVLAIVIDERFIEGRRVAFSKKLKLKNKPLFRSSELRRYDIDNLYSELVLFNL